MSTEQEDGELVPAFDISAIVKMSTMESEQTDKVAELGRVASPVQTNGGRTALLVRQMLKEAFSEVKQSNPNPNDPVWKV